MKLKTMKAAAASVKPAAETKAPKEPEKKPAKAEKKERKNAVGGEGKKSCVHIGNALDRYKDLCEVLTKNGLPPVTQSYVIREGARSLIERLISDAKKASKGVLHAKKR